MKELLSRRVGTARQECRQMKSGWFLPCHQGGTAWRTNRLGVSASEANSLLRQLAEMRGRVVLAAIASQVVDAEIVGQNENNVRLLQVCGRGKGRHGKRETKSYEAERIHGS